MLTPAERRAPWRRGGDRPDGWESLGSSVSDANGNFQIVYNLSFERSVLVLEADRGPVTLASAIGYGRDPPATTVVNERTTIATGNAFARFVNGRRVVGNAVVILIGAAAPLKTPVIGPPVPF